MRHSSSYGNSGKAQKKIRETGIGSERLGDSWGFLSASNYGQTGSNPITGKAGWERHLDSLRNQVLALIDDVVNGSVPKYELDGDHRALPRKKGGPPTALGFSDVGAGWREQIRQD